VPGLTAGALAHPPILAPATNGRHDAVYQQAPTRVLIQKWSQILEDVPITGPSPFKDEA